MTSLIAKISDIVEFVSDCNKIINENDESEIKFKGIGKFCILNGTLQFYINGQKINFNHTNLNHDTDLIIN